MGAGRRTVTANGVVQMCEGGVTPPLPPIINKPLTRP